MKKNFPHFKHSYFHADLSMGDIYAGRININHRIYTNDGMVKKLGEDKYQISPCNIEVNLGFFGESIQKNTSGIVTVTIDEKKYQGAEIIIDGNRVFIDGKQSAELNDISSNKLKK